MDDQVFSKFDALAGTKTPTGDAPVKSRADEVRSFGSGTSVIPTNSDSSSPGLFSRIGADFNDRVGKAADAQISADNGEQSKGSAVLQTLGHGAGFVGDVGAEGAKSALGLLNGLLSHAASNSDYQLPAAGGANLRPALEDPHIQAVVGKLKEFSAKHPEASGDLGAILNIAGIVPGGKAAELGLEGIGKGAELASKAGGKVADAAAATKDMAGSAVERAQLAATKGNQLPTLESAATGKTVPIPGDSMIRDPLARYDEHVATSQNAIKDAKADTALGKVGSHIGDAFEQEVKRRKEVGETMASELEKIGEKPTDLSDAITHFHSELNKNGVSLDAESGDLGRGKTSKLTESDTSLLNTYARDLHSLGPNPSIAELDAFLSRAPEELKVYKAKNNIIGTTNGERIVKNNLTQLRSQLDPAKTGKSYLKDYAAARKDYADTSKFLDEGVTHLGKKTQSGDYAKDASIAKSSVQSMLNNGKKDWLIALEKRTGYPAIDDATLALQSMKDTGDYRGASLLEAITKGAHNGELPSIPTTGTHIVNAALGKLLKTGARKFTGTPIEQTRRYLESLKK